MITLENYPAAIAKIGVANLTENQARAHSMIEKGSANYTKFDLLQRMMDKNPNIKEAVNNWLVRVAELTAEPAESKKKQRTKLRSMSSPKLRKKVGKILRIKGAEFAAKMKAAKQAKKARKDKSKEDSEKEAAATAAAGTKKGSTPKKTKSSSGKSPKPAKPVKEKKPTQADKNLAIYTKAKKVGHVSEEVKFIKKFLSLVHKSTREQVHNAAVALNKAVVQKLITKQSPHATEIKMIQEEMVRAANTAPYKVNLPEIEINNLVQIAGGEAVYKSIDIVRRFANWGDTSKTKAQIGKFLTEIKNAAKKVADTDPYAGRVKTIVKALESNKDKSSATFDLDAYELSGLAGILGCACQQGVSGLPQKKGKTKPRSVSGLGEVDAAIANVIATRPIVTLPAQAPAAPSHSLPTKSRFPSVMSAHEVMAIDYPTYEFKNDLATNDWGTLFGRPSKPFSAMISGSPGSGKSTLMMALAVYLAKNFGPTRYVSSEEYPSFTLADKLERAGGAVKDLSFSKDLSSISANEKFVIIDSTNHVKITLPDFLALKKRFPNTSFICILQFTKAGQFKGGNEWPHEVDAVFRVLPGGTVVTDKNRFVKEPGTIQVFKD